ENFGTKLPTRTSLGIKDGIRWWNMTWRRHKSSGLSMLNSISPKTASTVTCKNEVIKRPLFLSPTILKNHRNILPITNVMKEVEGCLAYCALKGRKKGIEFVYTSR